MTEEVLDAYPADEFWITRVAVESPCDLSAANRRHCLLATLAEAARRLHAANLFHRDFYWCHFFVRETERGRFTITLIDLQRVRRRRWTRWRWLVKDVAQFLFSAPDSVTTSDRLYWFRCYRGVERLSWWDGLLFFCVTVRAWLYRWKERSR